MSTLFLQFVQPAGLYNGGLAMEVNSAVFSPWSDGYRQDTTESALLVDPVVESGAVATPEVATMLAVASGLLSLLADRRLRRA